MSYGLLSQFTNQPLIPCKAFSLSMNLPGWMRSRCERMASQREAIYLVASGSSVNKTFP